MRRALSPAQAKAQDAWWIETCGIPSLTLMERAAQGVADAVVKRRKHGERVVAVCGRGNNAGDGYLCAALLQASGVPVTVVALYPVGSLTPDARTARERAVAAGVAVQDSLADLSHAVLIDALFGVGLSRDITGNAADAVIAMNGSGSPIVAVDIPSGLDGCSGVVRGVCVQATETVTFQHEKTGMLLGHGRDACGFVTVCRIADTDAPLDACAEVLEEADIHRLLPPRPRDSHKGKNGTALLCVGSPAYTGAAMLSTGACLRTGAGIVHVLAPHAVCEQVRRIPEAIVTDAGMTDWGSELCAFAVPHLEGKSAVGCGCGVGKGDITPLLSAVADAGIPYVFDADALNQPAARPELLQKLSARAVLTPHPGEMARLTGATVADILSDPIQAAVCASDAWGCTVLLKGAVSVIAGGGRVVLNTTGNAGLSKGGSGDVLTGIVTALLCQGLCPFDAACAGAYLLGAAADKALQLLGERALLASDVIDAVKTTVAFC